MRTASEASTVPSSQRWTTLQSGRGVKNAALVPVETPKTAFVPRLAANCVPQTIGACATERETRSTVFGPGVRAVPSETAATAR